MIPLVLVHGFMGGGAQWDGCLDHLDQRDVITIDLPGFGANADMAPMDRIGDFADWVICYLKAEGIRRYHLLGHSMGGMIAQEIALTDAAAVKKLILYATGAEGVLPGRFETIDESKKRAKTRRGNRYRTPHRGNVVFRKRTCFGICALRRDCAKIVAWRPARRPDGNGILDRYP